MAAESGAEHSGPAQFWIVQLILPPCEPNLSFYLCDYGLLFSLIPNNFHKSYLFRIPFNVTTTIRLRSSALFVCFFLAPNSKWAPFKRVPAQFNDDEWTSAFLFLFCFCFFQK